MPLCTRQCSLKASKKIPPTTGPRYQPVPSTSSASPISLVKLIKKREKYLNAKLKEVTAQLGMEGRSQALALCWQAGHGGRDDTGDGSPAPTTLPAAAAGASPSSLFINLPSCIFLGRAAGRCGSVKERMLTGWLAGLRRVLSVARDGVHAQDSTENPRPSRLGFKLHRVRLARRIWLFPH